MELHLALRQMVLDHGVDVLHDATTLRGALDDYFAEDDSFTAGDANLLVDGVRLGALATLVRLTEHGATPPAALRSASEGLIRERGGLDLDAAHWTCAVLGYAAGVVDDGLLRACPRPPTPTSSPPEPTAILPTVHLPPPPPPPPPPAPAPAGPPLLPTVQATRMSSPPPPAHPVAPLATSPGRWRAPLAVVALIALAIAAGVGVALLLTSGADDSNRAGDRRSSVASDEISPPSTEGANETSGAASSPSPSSRPHAAASGTPSGTAGADPGGVTGTWTGTITQVDERGTEVIELLLTLTDGRVGDRVGTTTYDLGDQVCVGRLTLLSSQVDGQQLREEILSGPCIANGQVRVHRSGTRLSFDYTGTKQSNGEAQLVSGLLDRAGA
ncbi:hypothetical protein GCM10025786_08360 [Nocardioides caeni]